MMYLGDYNVLTVIRSTPQGMYLEDEEANEVLLPNKYLTPQTKEGEKIEVFVYNDSEDRIIATTLKPKICINEFACLLATDVSQVGAFLDWGLEKDLMVPFSEQRSKMIQGNYYIVYLLLDEKTNRLIGTAKWNKYIERDTLTIKEGDGVDILICETTDLGVKVIINNLHIGLIFREDIHRTLEFGTKTTAFVKKIREDNKIDIILEPYGTEGIENHAERVLIKLRSHKGFLNLHDKSSAADIEFTLGMSKKAFKKAIGFLYKQRSIELLSDGIKLIEKGRI
ncbi:MAG: S1-like domain-containing RNA-binding protein [Bacteroidota bacterium]